MKRAAVLLVSVLAVSAAACEGQGRSDADASRDLDRYLEEFCSNTGVPWCGYYNGVEVQGQTATAELAIGASSEMARSLCMAIGATLFSNDPVVDASTTRIVLPDGQTLVERIGIAGRCD